MPKQTKPKQKQTTEDDLALLDELGLDTVPEKPKKLSAKEERIIAGFEEIEHFVEEQGRLPQHGEHRDIFERLYAVRLDRLRESKECRKVLQSIDSRGLLEADNDGHPPLEEDITDEDLLSTLGLDATTGNDITQLKHVRSRAEIKSAEEIAQRNPCEDFEQFKPVFENVQNDLDTGLRKTLKYQDNAAVNQGDMFILDGHKVIVAEMDAPFIADYGRQDRRLRVVYDNATESDLLMRSLQRSLNKDRASRRITTPDFGPLFSQVEAEDDYPTGYIYVLRSQSDDPFIAEHRSVVHKIGVTSGDVKQRIANAKKDPTYLLADVEIVTTFKLANINAKKLEALLQKFFSSARLDVELQDRFGTAVKPREWFLVPLEVIEQAIEKIREGTIGQFRYDPNTASLKQL
ncbi:GIY-YIG nuclease family protein [filamentous cyanobacterium LEGE 11480]|uniref:GIY-YIG nuclease family protein n=1 Tax=Romeriopsis navalis LEGE 11480 TaxID=2777977 RepID=A0A928Z2U9_9CYAN|nr:GIY-YIG nuclease family protein [Romeriopsis navalis]MBE9030781.1 GIY-YIG nuclease family protein [Romeriopsis navalis LEGE 11480]